jgi:hypothetical protein
MFGSITVRYKGLLAVRNVETAIRGVKREVMRHVANQWHSKFYETHFTAEGARKYRYARRHTKEITAGSVKRTKSGRPRAPDARPLFWSGRSYERGKAYKVTATPDRSRVTMSVPALNFVQKTNPIHMRAELEKVTASEEAELRRDAQAETTRLVQQLGGTNVRVSVHR